jgi:hypothetical protein
VLLLIDNWPIAGALLDHYEIFALTVAWTVVLSDVLDMLQLE